VKHVFVEAAQQLPAALLCKHQAALPEGEIQGFGDFTKAFTLEQRPALIAVFKI